MPRVRPKAVITQVFEMAAMDEADKLLQAEFRVRHAHFTGYFSGVFLLFSCFF